MRTGVVFPTMEIGNDPVAIRDFAQAAEALGYDHLTFQEHVLGADPNRDGGWQYGPMGYGRPGVTKDAAIHEPFVTCGYLAGLTNRIEFATGVLVLPQRQTALVAKQVAEIDILSGGRMRLGVGVGWNPVEFEALGEDFSNRGRREEEQIQLIRRLWEEEVIDFTGQWHRVDKAGINPRPARHVPIWLGGRTDVVLKRAVRLADGFITLGLQPGEQAQALVGRLQGFLKEAGRSPESFGFEGWTNTRAGTPDDWRATIEQWRGLGATHITLNVAGPASAGPDRHIEVMRRYREAIPA
jgi:probable F420-dependent oxidoreductase